MNSIRELFEEKDASPVSAAAEIASIAEGKPPE
jgi:hypothetical protein